jgi:hypothetical protein
LQRVTSRLVAGDISGVTEKEKALAVCAEDWTKGISVCGNAGGSGRRTGKQIRSASSIVSNRSKGQYEEKKF